MRHPYPPDQRFQPPDTTSRLSIAVLTAILQSLPPSLLGSEPLRVPSGGDSCAITERWYCDASWRQPGSRDVHPASPSAPRYRDPDQGLEGTSRNAVVVVLHDRPVDVLRDDQDEWRYHLAQAILQARGVEQPEGHV